MLRMPFFRGGVRSVLKYWLMMRVISMNHAEGSLIMRGETSAENADVLFGIKTESIVFIVKKILPDIILRADGDCFFMTDL